MLGNGRAHALYPGGEDVALWYGLKQCDGRPGGEHGRVLLLLLLGRERRGGVLGAVVLGGWGRQRNLDNRTGSDLCYQRV